MIAVVPTRNEPDVAATVNGLPFNEAADVVIVDDSDDPHEPECDRAITYIRGAGSLGGSLLLAYEYALACHSGLLQIDAGGSHDPAEARRFIVAPYSDVLVGSRFTAKGIHRGRRRHLSRLYSRLASRRAGHYCSDWTSGYRLYSPRALRVILEDPPTEEGHAFQVACLARCFAADLWVGEVPITYTPGESSLGWRRSTEAVKTLWRLR